MKKIFDHQILPCLQNFLFLLVNQGHTDYDLHSPILPEKGRYVVFMFVDQTPGNLEIEYRIIDRLQQELSRTAQLTAKGIQIIPLLLRFCLLLMYNINPGPEDCELSIIQRQIVYIGSLISIYLDHASQ